MEQLLETLIPAAKLASVEKALLETFHTTNVESIVPLTDRLTPTLVYKITVGNKPYVLRLIMQVNEINDPARQYVCMKLAAAAGITPHVHYANVEDALSITDFVEKTSWEGHLASRNELMVELAQTVKSIHSMPPFPKLVNFLDGIGSFIEQFKTLQMLPESATAEHFAYFAQLLQSYPRHDPDLVSSHNDLNFNNLLFDGKKFWIIDWDAAFLNDRYVDLANIANGYVRDEQQEETYLKAYFGDSLDDYKRARFFLMRQICHLFYAMVMMMLAAASKPAQWAHDGSMDTPRLVELQKLITNGEVSIASYEGQLLYGKVVLNEALHNMKSSRFVDAINKMKVEA